MLRFTQHDRSDGRFGERLLALVATNAGNRGHGRRLSPGARCFASLSMTGATGGSASGSLLSWQRTQVIAVTGYVYLLGPDASLCSALKGGRGPRRVAPFP